MKSAVGRNPRFDPADGDLLIIGSQRRLVMGVVAGAVFYEDERGFKCMCGIDVWREWAPKAMVGRSRG